MNAFVNGTPVTPDGFQFTISNGQVTAEQRVFGTHSINITIPTNASFAVSGNTVTETLTGAKGTDTRVYTLDASNPNLYHLSSDTCVVTTPTTTTDNGSTSGYTFTSTNGSITGVQHVFQGTQGGSFTHNLPLSPTATLSSNATGVAETLIYDNVVETIQFVAVGSAGLYAIASDSRSFVPLGSATTALSVDPYDRAKFTVDASGNITGAQYVLPNGSTVTPPSNSGVTYTQLAAGYIERVITHGSHTSYEVFHDGNGDGIYTAVAHGSGTTVDLIGLQTQMTNQIHMAT